jgi:hypothetical protein
LVGDAECFGPAVCALLSILQRSFRQPGSDGAHLLGQERHRHDLEAKIGEEEIAERLQLAGDADRHLVAGRITIARREHDHRPPVLGRVFCDLVEQGVADLAGREIEVGFIGFGDRQ